MVMTKTSMVFRHFANGSAPAPVGTSDDNADSKEHSPNSKENKDKGKESKENEKKGFKEMRDVEIGQGGGIGSGGGSNLPKISEHPQL
eukprot:CAMPEP_0114440830 /NCGR_PEP_ID=MMETSP0103-20121206/16011_1 /TAXON_ID=37642 ORGANISM="Paraphysomonas imperforata, Strain PA2" /NCGR_SAMPLE_ID=MMETSP0103 /ASSEMBLY_ACC=CAM_ASM_000201 /LENGTH=87 /DNA_ID=CAMNT_0001611825 /DNA_START=240 /DNA_END=503 /DNA_ORIENTATION=-